MDLLELADKIYQRTLFLATNAIDIMPLAKLNLVNYSVILNASEFEKKRFSSSCFFVSPKNKDIKSISSLPEIIEAKNYITDNFENFNYVWLFRPYSWSDDFSLKGKNILSGSYYKYLSISRKLHQDQQLYKHGDNYLRDHISMKENYLSREIILTGEGFYKRPGDRIIFSASSTGCSGVRTDYPEQVLKENLFIKSDKLIKRNIPVCQNAVIIGDNVIKYQPKISIIDLSKNQLAYHGGDYSFASMYFNTETLKRISRITHSVSKALAKIGFKGVVNCDYIYNPDDDVILFVEVNPRYSACTFVLDSYFSNAERNQEFKKLMPSILHAAAFSETSYVTGLEEVSHYFEEDQYVEMEFLKSDTKSFLKRSPSLNLSGGVGTSIYRKSIISSPEFPVTLSSGLEETM